MTIKEVLVLEATGQRKKRNPPSQLEKQIAAITTLPRKEKPQLLAVAEAFISQHASR